MGVRHLGNCAAVTVKRLHDRNKAWWWIVVFIFAPDALFGLAEVLADSETANESALFAIQFAALALAAWGAVELGFLRGTAGANRFGPDPAQGTAVAIDNHHLLTVAHCLEFDTALRKWPTNNLKYKYSPLIANII